MDVMARLAELGLNLPAAPRPVAAYVPAVRVGNLVFVSGQGAIRDSQVVMQGYVGRELSLEQGVEAARLCALNALAVLREAIGDLNRVKRVVKVTGWVRSAPGFTQQHLVINGFSELMVQVFGERGRHARSAVGANELPLGTPVEVELVVAVEE